MAPSWLCCWRPVRGRRGTSVPVVDGVEVLFEVPFFDPREAVAADEALYERLIALSLETPNPFASLCHMYRNGFRGTELVAAMVRTADDDFNRTIQLVEMGVVKTDKRGQKRDGDVGGRSGPPPCVKGWPVKGVPVKWSPR